MAEMLDPQKTEEAVKKVLQDAGLESNPIDPASLAALKEYMTQAPSLKTASSDDDGCWEPLNVPPMKSVGSPKATFFQRQFSDLTNQVNAGEEAATNDSTAGFSGLATEERLLMLVEQQTAMIYQLRNRVDELHAKVDHLSSSVKPSPPPPPFLKPTTFVPPAPQQPAAAAAAAAAAPLQARPRLVVLPLLGNLVAALGQIPRGLQNSRFYKIFKLFNDLRRRQVPAFDMALLVKVIVMVAILMARMSNKHNDNDDDSLVWMYRFYLVTGLILAGFLVQSGYAKFVYNFFIKHNYPGRIWDGEEIEVEAAVQAERQEPQRRPDPRAAARDQQDQQQQQPHQPPGWHNAILQGQIPRNDNAAGGGPLQLIFETAVLIGSFFLSILPMWTPQAPPPPPPPPPQPEEEEEQQQQHPQGGNAEDAAGELPQVQPPRDPTEYEEDD